MEFEIKGVKYRTAKLSVFDQLKVTRKLLPVLAGMMSDFGSIRSRLPADGKIDTVKFEHLKPVFETMLPRIAEELSSLTEDDTSAIIHPCLAVVSRRHMDGWVPVFTQGELMFDDIDLLVMLQLVARVVADSLGNFFAYTPYQHDAEPATGLTFNSLPDGLSYLLNPVDAGLIPYTALKDGSVDLYDIALLNDHLAVKADNQRRIEKWREDNDR